MTPQEQKLAIADMCGWHGIKEHPAFPGLHLGMLGPLRAFQEIPDYPNDLNAMNEAEKVLSREQQDNYANELYSLLPCDENAGPVDVDDPSQGDIMLASQFQVAHASAALRAEALLKAIGKT